MKIENSIKNRFTKYIYMALIVIAGLLLFSACSKKKNAYIYQNSITYTCKYNASENTTRIDISARFLNEDIYDTKTVALNFDFYKGETKLYSNNITWDFEIKHGQEKVLVGYFIANNDVDSIEYVSFSAKFKGLWESYYAWWLGAICGAILLLIILSLIVCINDVEIDEFFEWIGEHYYFLFILSPLVVPFFMNNWVAGLILIGGLVAILVLLLPVFLVKYIIDNQKDSIPSGDIPLEEFSLEEIKRFTIAELKEICRYNGIIGYSTLNKSKLIELLCGNNESDDMESDDNELSHKTDALPTKADKKKNANNHIYIPKIKLTDIAGLDEAKKALEERVILPIKHREIYDKYNKKVGGGILLFGLPGTGKTMFAQAVATELNAEFCSVKCSDIESKWSGEAEQNIRNLFSKARKNPRAVIFFDEFDSLGARRSEENDNGVHTVQEILAQMHGIETSKNLLLVVAATNCPWNLDGALLRPGRFSEKIYIPLPDKNARLFILKKNLAECNLDKHVDLTQIAEDLDGCNGADITEFCEKIKMCLIKKEINNFDAVITVDDATDILNSTKSSVLQSDVIRMEKFISEQK